MKVLLRSLRGYAFWGSMILLLLVKGLYISIADIWETRSEYNSILRIFSHIILFSPIIFASLLALGLVLLLISESYPGVKGMNISFNIIHCLSMPFGGFRILNIGKFRIDYLESETPVGDIVLGIWGLIESVVWWVALILAIYSIFITPNSIYYNAIIASSPKQKMICIGVIVIFMIITQLICKLMIRMNREHIERTF